MAMTMAGRHAKTTDGRLMLGAALALVSVLFSAAAGAQVYRVTDEQGNVSFTDRPQAPSESTTVERVELQTTNSAPAVTPQAAPTTPSAEAQDAPAPAPRLTVAIVAPADETTIAMGPGNFSVSATTQPPLGRGEQLQLMIDGEPQGEAQRSSSWFVEGALRGEHNLRVVRLNSAGSVIAESEGVRVYVLRPSVLRR
jgi:cytoskeletal protein RodZ